MKYIIGMINAAAAKPHGGHFVRCKNLVAAAIAPDRYGPSRTCNRPAFMRNAHPDNFIRVTLSEQVQQ